LPNPRRIATAEQVPCSSTPAAPPRGGRGCPVRRPAPAACGSAARRSPTRSRSPS